MHFRTQRFGVSNALFHVLLLCTCRQPAVCRGWHARLAVCNDRARWHETRTARRWQQEAAHQLRLADGLPPRVAGRPQEVDVADARHLRPPPAQGVAAARTQFLWDPLWQVKGYKAVEDLRLAAPRPRPQIQLRLCQAALLGWRPARPESCCQDLVLLRLEPHTHDLKLINGWAPRCGSAAPDVWCTFTAEGLAAATLLRRRTSTGDWKLMNSPARARSSGSSSSRSCPLYVALPPITS